MFDSIFRCCSSRQDIKGSGLDESRIITLPEKNNFTKEFQETEKLIRFKDANNKPIKLFRLIERIENVSHQERISEIRLKEILQDLSKTRTDSGEVIPTSTSNLLRFLKEKYFLKKKETHK